MEFWAQNVTLCVLIALGLFLAFLDLGGNWFLLFVGIGAALYTHFQWYTPQFLAILLAIFVFGQLWEFGVSFFGIKRKEVSWTTTMLVGVGALIVSIWGTLIIPLFGTLLGGAAGACVVAYTMRWYMTGDQKEAEALAWLAFKTQLLAVAGKMLAGLVMAIMLFWQLQW